MGNETVYKGFKFRLYPTREQIQSLSQHAGNARFLWNHIRHQNQEHHKRTQKFLFSGTLIRSLPSLKRDPKTEFLQKSHSQSLQQVCKDWDTALKRFTSKVSGFPQPKRKNKSRDSFTIHQAWRYRKGAIKIPKIGWVPWKKHRSLEGLPKSITVSRDGLLWFVSILCEIPKTTPLPILETSSFIGVDLGIKDLAVLSDGTVIPNARLLKRNRKTLRRASQNLSRKNLGSKSREKARIKLQIAHRKVRNRRKDLLHKLSHSLVKNHDVVVMEDLHVKGMVRNRKLSKAISDMGWGELRRQVEYKASWNGKSLILVNRFFPSSKTCSSCGAVKQDLKLSERIYQCGSCDIRISRDLNAAINLEREGRRLSGLKGTVGRTGTPTQEVGDACGDSVRHRGDITPSLGSAKQEKELRLP